MEFWAIGNRGGWGRGYSIEQAIRFAVAGSRRGKMIEGDTFLIYELDPALPITHISHDSGHAYHWPDPERYSRVRAYRRNEFGEYLPPQIFCYEKNAKSPAGAHLAPFAV